MWFIAVFISLSQIVKIYSTMGGCSEKKVSSSRQSFMMFWNDCQFSSTDLSSLELLMSGQWFLMSNSMFFQLALLYWRMVRAGRQLYVRFITVSTTSVEWSNMPGTLTHNLVIEGLFVMKRSNSFSPLVGALCKWLSEWVVILVIRELAAGLWA